MSVNERDDMNARYQIRRRRSGTGQTEKAFAGSYHISAVLTNISPAH
jgi:hypothetical protein